MDPSVVLRDGIDKIHMTVREKGHKKYRFPRHIALMYSDRLSKLKFSDRYAQVIHFQKYAHKTWRYLGDDKSTYCLEYFLRLDGMRQMRVFLNCMRLYNFKNGLELYKGRLFDDNVVVPSRSFDLLEFVELVRQEIPKIINDYIEIRKRVFRDIVNSDDLTLDTHQVEIVIEGIGLHTSDVSDTFMDFARCDSFKIYHDHTNTHYLNTTGQRQLKIYQKGIGILRLEATFNNRPQDIVFRWNEHSVEDTVRYIREEIDDLYEHMNIPKDWWKHRKMSREKLIHAFTDTMGLRREGKKNGILDIGLMKTLISIKNWSSNSDNQALTKRLRRKRLIKPVGRGQYVPSENLRIIQELFAKLDRMNGVYEE